MRNFIKIKLFFLETLCVSFRVVKYWRLIRVLTYYILINSAEEANESKSSLKINIKVPPTNKNNEDDFDEPPTPRIKKENRKRKVSYNKNIW